MRIAIPAEIEGGETRVAATPETVKKLIGARRERRRSQAGAGARLAAFPTPIIEAAGATIAKTAEGRRSRTPTSSSRSAGPAETELKDYRAGALVVAIMDPYGADEALAPMAEAGLSAFAMELMPRITRAQVMDVLSSPGQPRRLPRGDRRRGRVRPRHADDDDRRRHRAGRQGLRHGRRRRRPAGHRHGAAPRRRRHRHRRASRRQGAGRILGAKFVAVEDEEFKQAETAAGYAKPMSAEYQAKQAALVAEHIKKQDIVITTALIPGRPAPRLVTAAMVEIDEARLGDRRPRRRAGRQCRGRRCRRSRDRPPTASRSSATSTCPAASPPTPRRSTPATCSPSSRP